ncbi:hypothetical protein [Bacillus sp. 03113]|uniref:hypothetical protein n=1 Tax=Bacillus sp. 03113 TaxID=2578211 RepID=UPI00114424F1|nr:hypothetical protein [Bacillus sp. 03113]
MAEEGIKANCDGCKLEFEIKMQTEIIENNVEKNYFICPHCNKEYISFCINQSIRKKQSDLKMLWRELQTATTVKKHHKIHSKIELLQKTIK